MNALFFSPQMFDSVTFLLKMPYLVKLENASFFLAVLQNCKHALQSQGTYTLYVNIFAPKVICFLHLSSFDSI